MTLDDAKAKLRKAAGKGPSRQKALREPVTSIAKVESDRGRKNSRVKGNRGELDVAKLFSQWSGELVKRTPGSGGWGGSQEFGTTADLICKKKAFIFAIEVKHREGWVLDDLVTGIRKDHDKSIVQWWIQASAATPSGKEPLLVFRRNHQPWLAMALSAGRTYDVDVSYMTAAMNDAAPEHRNVIVVSLDAFLENEPVPRGLKNHRPRRLSTGMTDTRTYSCWENMVQRCTNPKAKRFHRYGGRGVRVCARWWRFDNFFVDMGECPDGMSLDRKDNDGDYTPENCRWATAKTQSNNRSDNRRLISADGRDLTIAEWSRETGIGWKTIAYRVDTGWSADQAIGLAPRPAWARKAKSS
jgi:Holliday junction resolvase